MMELQETVKLRRDGDSFTINKRKRDAQREESEECGFSHRLSSNTSDHNQQIRSLPWRISQKARSSNNSVRKKASKCSSPTTEQHIETETAELLYGLKTSRNQDSSEKLQTRGKNKVEDKSSSKAYVPNKDIKKVNLESIDLMDPPPSTLHVELRNNTFKKNQDVIKIPNQKDNDILTRDTLQEDKKQEQPPEMTNHPVKETVSSAAWSRNIAPLGYVPPSLQPIVKTDKTIPSSTALQLVGFVLSPPQPKRCASHHYIARNIFLHQQLLRVNNICPRAVNSSSLCGTKPNNVNDAPTPEIKIVGQQSQNDFLGVKRNSTQVKKELVASKFPSLDSMQMEQLTGNIMHQPSPTSHAGGGNSSCAPSSNNSSQGNYSSLSTVRGSSPAAQNPSTSIGFSSSQRVQVKANNMLCSSVAQPQHKLMTEICKEKSPSILGQKNVYGQNFTIPIQPKNFSFKKQETLKAGFDLVSSQSFAISFHSQPSVAWQGYNQTSSLISTHQDDEKKVTSGKSSTNLVFYDSSKYLSFVLSPQNITWIDDSQHLLQLHKQHNVQQQQSPMVTQYKASNSSTISATELVSNSFLSHNFPHCNSPNPPFHSKSSKRPVDSQHFPNPKTVSQEQGRVLQGHAQISFGEKYKSFTPLQVQRQLNNNQSSNITFARYLPNGGNSKRSKVCSTVSALKT